MLITILSILVVAEGLEMIHRMMTKKERDTKIDADNRRSLDEYDEYIARKYKDVGVSPSYHHRLFNC